MAVEGHAPSDSRTAAYRLAKLGEGKCPDCRGNLRKAGDGYSCQSCKQVYPVGRCP